MPPHRRCSRWPRRGAWRPSRAAGAVARARRRSRARARSACVRGFHQRPDRERAHAALLVVEPLGDAHFERRRRLIATRRLRRAPRRRPRSSRFARRRCGDFRAQLRMQQRDRDQADFGLSRRRPLGRGRRRRPRRRACRARRAAIGGAARGPARLRAQHFLADAQQRRRPCAPADRTRTDSRPACSISATRSRRAPARPASRAPRPPARAGNNRPAIPPSRSARRTPAAPRSRTNVSGSKPVGMKIPRPSRPACKKISSARNEALRPAASPSKQANTLRV